MISLKSCFLNDNGTPETDRMNGMIVICMPNLGSACSKTIERQTPSEYMSYSGNDTGDCPFTVEKKE